MNRKEHYLLVSLAESQLYKINLIQEFYGMKTFNKKDRKSLGKELNDAATNKH